MVSATAVPDSAGCGSSAGTGHTVLILSWASSGSSLIPFAIAGTVEPETRSSKVAYTGSGSGTAGAGASAGSGSSAGTSCTASTAPFGSWVTGSVVSGAGTSGAGDSSGDTWTGSS